MTKIKICGIRRVEDAIILNEILPDYAGFILSKQFWRCIDKKQLSEICGILSKNILRVGVFVNESLDYILEYAPFLDVIQLHGEEDETFIRQLKDKTTCEVWKAVRVKSSQDIENACNLSADKLLIDSYSKKTYGGSGELANWDLVKNAKISKPFFLAGGISSENCTDAITLVKPYGLDISSSVETNRIKDREKIVEIFSKIRGDTNEK